MALLEKLSSRRTFRCPVAFRSQIGGNSLPGGALSHCDHALDEAGGRAKASEQPRMTAGLSGASERVVVR